jgi:hypothetical protein
MDGFALLCGLVLALVGLYVLWLVFCTPSYEFKQLDKEVASLSENVQWLRQAELARGTSPLTRSQMSDVQKSDEFSNWLYAKVNDDIKKAMKQAKADMAFGPDPVEKVYDPDSYTTWSYEQKENAPVSSCSAKERITEMRLRALETGQPIDTMELVREAISALERSRTGSRVPYYGSSISSAEYYKDMWNFEIENERTALALLRFAVERAAPQEGDVTLVRESL